VRGEEIEHGAKHGRIAKSCPQDFRREPGQREETLGPALALQQPAEGGQGESLRINRG